MQTRLGFARLVSLVALTGVIAGAIALMVSERQMPAPAVCRDCGWFRWPAPDLDIGRLLAKDGHLRAWNHAHMPLRTVEGLRVGGASRARLDVHGKVLYDCDFGRASLVCANLSGAGFVDCDFQGASLTCADMRNSFFRSCHFEGADLSAVALDGATFDEATRWPAGFDPTAHGVREVEWYIQ
jgi:hypothetical protein